MDNYDSMTWTNQCIAKTMLDNCENLYKFSVSKIAEEANVSPAMIIKFAKNISLSGFDELKYLAKYSDTESHKDITGITNAIYLSHENNKDRFGKIAERIKHSKRIFIYAQSNSANIAFDFYYKFSKVRKDVYIFKTLIEEKESFISLAENDLIIIVSNIGNNREILSIFQQLDPKKKTKEQVILVTNNEKGKLIKHACESLIGQYHDYNNDYSQYLPFSNKYSLMYLLDSVFFTYFYQYHEECVGNLKKWKFHLTP